MITIAIIFIYFFILFFLIELAIWEWFFKYPKFHARYMYRLERIKQGLL